MNYYLFKPWGKTEGSFVVRIYKKEEKFFDELCFNRMQDSEEIPVEILKIRQSQAGKFSILDLAKLKRNYLYSLSDQYGTILDK